MPSDDLNLTDPTTPPGNLRRMAMERLDQTTAAERIMRGGRTQPLTPVERAFFERPDHMVKPRRDEDCGATGQRYPRVPIEIHPATRERLRKVLVHDARFNGTYGNGIGYSEFINRALDALGCEG